MITSVFTLLPSIHIRPILFFPFFFLQEMARVCDMSGQRGSCNGGRTSQINLSGWITHTSCKIAVHRGQSTFAWGQNAVMSPDAGTAARICYSCSGLHEDFQVAETHGFKIHFRRGRYNDHARARAKRSSWHDLGRDSVIVETSIRAW